MPNEQQACLHVLRRPGRSPVTDRVVGQALLVGPGFVHDVARYFVKHTPWLDSLIMRADDALGYGKFRNPTNFWREDVRVSRPFSNRT